MSPTRRFARALARRRAGDGGLTIVEVVVAIALLGAIVAPMIRIVLSTGSAADQDRLRVEAVNLATQDIENYENSSFFNVFSTQTQTVTYNLQENGGKTSEKFTVKTRFRAIDENGSSVCASGTNSPQIWDVIATVSWTGDGTPVRQSTYVAPEQAGAVPTNGGTLAIPIDTSDLSNTPYTGDVHFTVIGTWTGGGSPQTSKGDTSYATGDTDSGCAVVNGLYAVAGWQYQVYVGIGNGPSSLPSNQTDVVLSNDLPDIVDGSLATSRQIPQVTTPVSLTVGSTTTVQPPIYVAPATPAAGVTFRTERCKTVTSCTDVTSTVPPPPVLPVTASASEMPANAVFDTAGNGAISSISLWPYVDYGIWAGDTNDSSPGDTVGGTPVYSGDAPVAYDAAISPPPSMPPLPVYPVVLSTAAPPAGEALSAQEVTTPGESIPLYAYSGTTSSTGLPLGQYRLVATAGLPVVSPQYIWVTPTGTWTSPTQMTSPSVANGDTFTAAGTAIPVVL